MPPSTPGDASRRRFLLDNLILFFWVGYLVPASLALWTTQGRWQGLAGLLIGHSAALPLVILPGLSPRRPSANTPASAPVRSIRLIGLSSLFCLAIYQAHAFLLALLENLGLFSGRLGWSGLTAGSPAVFLIFLGYWAWLLSLVAERLVAWIRELLKIDRLVCLGFAAFLLISRLTGRSGAIPVDRPGLGLPNSFGFAFAFTLATSLGLTHWKGHLGPATRCWLPATLLVLGGPLMVLLVLLFAGTTIPAPDSLPPPVSPTGGPLPSTEVLLFLSRIDAVIPGKSAQALLNLALSLGSMGLAVYLAHLIAVENTRGRGWPLRMAWSLFALLLSSALLAGGLLDNLVLSFLLLGILLAPLAGMSLSEALRRTTSSDRHPRAEAALSALGPLVVLVCLANHASLQLLWAAPPTLLILSAIADRLIPRPSTRRDQPEKASAAVSVGG